MENTEAKSLVWVGSSYKDLKAMPGPVQDDVGYAIWLAQIGQKYYNAKPLKGFSGVFEIISDYQTDYQKTASTCSTDGEGGKRLKNKKKGDIEYYEGSRNVYKDLGFKNPEEWATKAALATKIYDLIESKGLTQKQAAEILGIDQPGVSDLKRGRFRRFSIARMLAFLRALDQDIDIVIRPKVDEVAQIQVAETR